MNKRRKIFYLPFCDTYNRRTIITEVFVEPDTSVKHFGVYRPIWIDDYGDIGITSEDICRSINIYSFHLFGYKKIYGEKAGIVVGKNGLFTRLSEYTDSLDFPVTASSYQYQISYYDYREDAELEDDNEHWENDTFLEKCTDYIYLDDIKSPNTRSPPN